MSTISEWKINSRKNEGGGEYNNSISNTRRFVIKHYNKLTLVVFNPPICHYEFRPCDQINLITSSRKNLRVLQLNENFNIMCVYNLDVKHAPGTNVDAWGKGEKNKIAPNLIKTVDPQIGQLLDKALFYRNNQSACKLKVICPLSEKFLLPEELLKTPDPPPPPHINFPLEDTTLLSQLAKNSLQLNLGPPRPQGFASSKLDSDPGVLHLRLMPGSDKTYHPLQAADTESEKGAELGQTKSLISLYSSHKLPVAMRTMSVQPNFRATLEDENFDPFEHRHPPHPTTDLDTFIHLIKGSLGSGILAMPWAFKSSGLFFGLFATCLVGMICAYCVHILVKCSHILCRKLKVACLGFDDIAEVAFFAGPPQTKRFAKLGRFTVNLFLVVDLLGCCCCYVVFVGENLKQVLDAHIDKEIDLRICMLGTLPLFILICMIPHLKWIAPLSMVANILMAVGMLITFYFIITDLPSPTTRPQFSSVGQLPVFFGTCIFALEGIGVIMPLENNMKTPQHFLPCFGVLNLGMGFVITLYACLGFLGYLRYGDTTEASITLNLPDSYLAQSVKSMIAIAIFLTYALQFHVPLEIIWKGIKHYFPRHQWTGQYILRVFLVIMTVMISIAVPHLGPCISLVGALCLSFLGLLFPAIVEILVRWELGFGFAKWILWKNIGLILFGLLGFFTGSYVSILDIIAESQKAD